MTEFDPKQLRDAFGKFMTGVTVVTTRDGAGQPQGFTANSFTSVSLDPPLLLVCPGKFLSSFEAFAQCSHFAVNILAEGQEEISNTFASYKGDRFEKVAHRINADGVPVIDGAIAQFSCTTHQVIPAGDHCVLMGRVTGFETRDRAGLGYAGGQYFSLGLERGALEPTDKSVVCGAIVDVGGRVLLQKTQSGFQPPQITQAGRLNLRPELQAALSRLGVTAQLGPAYSVFDDPVTHSAYILATADAAPDTGELEAVAIRDLPDLTYSSQPIADMMKRYAIEAQTRDFSLYLGDAQAGETHVLSERI